MEVTTETFCSVSYEFSAFRFRILCSLAAASSQLHTGRNMGQNAFRCSILNRKVCQNVLTSHAAGMTKYRPRTLDVLLLTSILPESLAGCRLGSRGRLGSAYTFRTLGPPQPGLVQARRSCGKELSPIDLFISTKAQEPSPRNLSSFTHFSFENLYIMEFVAGLKETDLPAVTRPSESHNSV